MNVKRALWIAVVMYISSFIIGIIAMALFGDASLSLAEMPTSFFVIGVIISVVLAGLFSLLYFKGKGTRANTQEGLYFGVIIILVGFVLDLIFFFLGSLGGTETDILGYYSHPGFWVAVILVLATTALIGKWKSSK